MQIYDNKIPSYFSAIRMDLVGLLPSNPDQVILEIGAGSGSTLAYLKEKNLAKHVTGIELFEIKDSLQKNQVIDEFIIGNIENMDLEKFNEQFDVVICGDVLEHLIDPWKVVEKIASLIKPQGILIVSIPNFRDIKTLYNVFVKGDFKYEKSGVLDETHLRFFCKKNILKLLTTSSLKPVKIWPSFLKNPNQINRKRMSELTLGIFKNFLTVQYLVIARKIG